MDFELSRCIERTASLESQLSRTERELDEATKALEQMNTIVKHQINEPLGDGTKHFFHSLTCGNNSNHARLFPFWTGSNVVLKCPDCDYVQTYLPGIHPLNNEDDSDVGC